MREADEEIVYVVGPMVGAHNVGELEGYPFPAIQDELGRLKDRFVAAGGNPGEAAAWAPGVGYCDHLADLRSKIRQQEGDAA